jgi:hypothetical protein
MAEAAELTLKLLKLGQTVRRLKSRHCTFSNGWHLWQKREPLLRGDPQRLHFALLDEGHGSNWRSPDQRNLPAEQVIERRWGPAIWHMVDFNLRGSVQPCRRQVMWGSEARRSDGELVGISFAVGDQLFHVVRGKRWLCARVAK